MAMLVMLVLAVGHLLCLQLVWWTLAALLPWLELEQPLDDHLVAVNFTVAVMMRGCAGQGTLKLLSNRNLIAWR